MRTGYTKMEYFANDDPDELESKVKKYSMQTYSPMDYYLSISKQQYQC
ncbi:MAG: hypothetical protein AABX74_06565 [Nanoarchaeota archaeon]